MKKPRSPLSTVVFLILLMPALPTPADTLFIVRTHHPLTTTLNILKQEIGKQGYTVARVDMVNIGLLGMGYTSNSYRAVFFGKAEEIRELSHSYPSLIPYLPPRIGVFSEGDSTLLVTVNPSTYKELLPPSERTGIFRRWEQDLEEIFSRMATVPRGH